MKKVLLAEYDEFLINVYAGELRRAGYNISVVTNGEIVVNRVKSVDPDLLILDASLPGPEGLKNGFSVLKKLRGDADLNKLKIVMISNYAAEELQENPNFGVLKSFSKAEFTAKELVDEVGRILN